MRTTVDRHSHSVLVAALTVGMGVAGARLHSAPPVRLQQTEPTLCMDEKGAKYSQNALRRVVDQIQACAAGMWILDPSQPPKDPKAASAKSCRSERAADKGQEYAAGLLRSFDDPSTKKPRVERCDDGEWNKVTGTTVR